MKGFGDPYSPKSAYDIAGHLYKRCDCMTQKHLVCLRVRLPASLSQDLDMLCQHLDGSSKASVIRLAVDRLARAELPLRRRRKKRKLSLAHTAGRAA